MKINFDRILFLINIIVSLFFIITLGCYNIIPLKYLIGIFAFLVIINALLFYLLVYKTKFKEFTPKKITGYIVSVIMFIIIGFITYYSNMTMNFLEGVSGSKYKEENFLVLVLKDSKKEKISELNNIGYTFNELTNIEKAVEKLRENSIKITKYDATDKMFSELRGKKIEAALIEESIYDLLNDQHKFEEEFKIIDKINIKTEINIAKEIDVTKQPFAVYLSGIDSFGNIATVSRSDVNIVAVINPQTKQILLVSVPRDYYVQLRGTTGLKDKLTHAGIYGVETSIGTLEDLLKTDINYYARVNFTSVIKIVDALGGIDVYSKYDFTSMYDENEMYHFQKGYNHMNGNQALAFARERHQIAGGDRVRGMNQQAIIDGVLRKATSPAIMPAFSKILASLKGTFQTNMEDTDIQKLIKMQLDDMAKWNITSEGLDGSDSSNYTYSYSGQRLYVMEPNMNTVNKAINLIDQVLNGEILEGTYDKDASNVKNPSHVKPVPKPDPIVDEKPTIEFKTDTINITKGQTIDLLKDVNAFDKEDGKLKANVNIKDTSVLIEGTHEIVYSVKDSKGQETIKIRKLIVKLDTSEDDKKTESDIEDKKPESDIENKNPNQKPETKPELEQKPETEKKPENDSEIKKDEQSQIKPKNEVEKE